MKFLNFHTHQLSNDEESIDIISIRQGGSFPLSNALYGYGIHPWDTIQENRLELTDDITKDKNLIYIGEAGMDKLKGAELQLQIQVFKQHILASEKLGKPLLIHCVRCFNELIQLHKEHAPQQKWVVHGFVGSPQLAKQLAEAGFMLTFGAGIINKESKAAHSLKIVPIELLLLETDDAPISIQKIYKAAADILQLNTSELKKEVLNNFARATDRNL